ncbi:variable large family protein [Borrelia persica]|uniref:variable large family protein n=1 Tax=Borrelia persica TaxID=44448 RepID=UPI000571413F|nr:variable large family protein [Borrelia persica]
MKKVIKRSLIIIMILGVMGCNNGVAELEKKNEFLSSIANLGKGFLDVFVAFGDMITDTLGIKADTKKSEIGAYFTKIENTMKTVKEKLGKIVGEYGNYPKVKEKVEEFIGKIGKIEEGAKEAAGGAIGSDAIGNSKQNEDAVPANKDAVNSFVKGIKDIVSVVLKKNEGNSDFTKTDVEQQKTIGVLLGQKNNGGEEKHAAAASATIGAVSGADILQAIAKSDAVSNDPKIETAQSAADIAAAGSEDNKNFNAAKKDAVIAAGIALRAMAKEGKFAIKNNDANSKTVNAVNGAVASAVNKALSTLIIAIRNTVDNGLKEINEVLAKVKQEDKTAEAANSEQQ